VEDEEYRRMAAVEQSHWWYVATRQLLRELLGPSLHPGAVLLDAGSGTGATGAWLAEHGRVVALDAEPQALRLYGELHADAGRVLGDLGRLPFADGVFDAALCVTVLYHQAISDPAAAMIELARVVRPGGVVCALEPGVRRLRRSHDRETHAARRFSLDDLRRLARNAGLEVRRATGAYSFLVPPAAVKSVAERGRSASDLDVQPGGFGGALGAAARAERSLIRRVGLPFGLSVAVVARKPAAG
jgi:ubiquinone/menaquinone biosynthesis C-methylase UbiE